MTDRPHILLAHHLKALKPPTFLREYEKVARQCAAEGLDHVQFLARLVELELITSASVSAFSSRRFCSSPSTTSSLMPLGHNCMYFRVVTGHLMG